MEAEGLFCVLTDATQRLHATAHAKRGGKSRENARQELNDGFPSFLFHLLILFLIQVSHVKEFIEVKEVITPFGRSGS